MSFFTGALLLFVCWLLNLGRVAQPTSSVPGGTPAAPEYEASLTGFADAVNAVF